MTDKDLTQYQGIDRAANKVATPLTKTRSQDYDYDKLALFSHYIHGKVPLRDAQSQEKTDEAIEYILRKRGYDREAHEESLLESPQFFNYGLFPDFFDVPFPDPTKPEFTFIDLFAGIGGFRLAMQAQNGKCVFSSEWNKFARQTYLSNFGEIPYGDITKEETKNYIPDNFDILCAGFPCQPFSIAGISKKKSLGRETGFKDKTQGTLFFDVADILYKHRPKAFLLENVKNLVSHDKGKTFKVIQSTLEELNYSVHYKIMDGKDYVPQHRERIIIVGFNNEIFHNQENFSFPEPKNSSFAIKNILEEKVHDKYTLSDKLWQYLQNYAVKQKAKGNGFGFGLVDLNGIARTLSARYYKDGSEILIPQGKDKNPRKLTPRECARLMGFPDSYRIDQVSDVQAYRQCGNSVVVPLITAVAEKLIKTIKEYEQHS